MTGKNGTPLAGLTHLGWVYGAGELALIASRFDAEDIPVFFHGTHIHQLMPHASVGLGGVKIMTLPKYKIAAKALLQSVDSSVEPRLSLRALIILSLLWLLFGVPAGPHQAVYRREETTQV